MSSPRAARPRKPRAPIAVPSPRKTDSSTSGWRRCPATARDEQMDRVRADVDGGTDRRASVPGRWGPVRGFGGDLRASRRRSVGGVALAAVGLGVVVALRVVVVLRAAAVLRPLFARSWSCARSWPWVWTTPGAPQTSSLRWWAFGSSLSALTPSRPGRTSSFVTGVVLAAAGVAVRVRGAVAVAGFGFGFGVVFGLGLALAVRSGWPPSGWPPASPPLSWISPPSSQRAWLDARSCAPVASVASSSLSQPPRVVPRPPARASRPGSPGPRRHRRPCPYPPRYGPPTWRRNPQRTRPNAWPIRRYGRRIPPPTRLYGRQIRQPTRPRTRQNPPRNPRLRRRNRPHAPLTRLQIRQCAPQNRLNSPRLPLPTPQPMPRSRRLARRAMRPPPRPPRPGAFAWPRTCGPSSPAPPSTGGSLGLGQTGRGEALLESMDSLAAALDLFAPGSFWPVAMDRPPLTTSSERPFIEQRRLALRHGSAPSQVCHVRCARRGSSRRAGHR